ncbi:MAG: hypothetical protein HC889_19715 [Synechococcaceae cyanobacterium SM1_2_3]|nr:hypothetical protein [Synechococcaceae cyanobacterium SM1_2_3]
MRVASLDIAGFRNLRETSLRCAPGLNLIVGPNAPARPVCWRRCTFWGAAAHSAPPAPRPDPDWRNPVPGGGDDGGIAGSRGDCGGAGRVVPRVHPVLVRG